MALNFSDVILVIDVNKNGNRNESYLIYNYTNKREETITVDELKAYLLNHKALNYHQQTFKGTVICRPEDDNTLKYVDEMKDLLKPDSFKRLTSRLNGIPTKNTTTKSTNNKSTANKVENTKVNNAINNVSSGCTDNKEDLRNSKMYIKDLLTYCYQTLGAEIKTKISPSGEILFSVENIFDYAISKIIVSKDRIDCSNGEVWKTIPDINTFNMLISSNLAARIICLNDIQKRASNENIENLTKQLESYKTTLQATQDALNESNDKLENLEKKLAEANGEKLVYLSEKNNLSYANNELNKKIKELEERNKELQEGLEILQDSIEQSFNVNEQINSENDDTEETTEEETTEEETTESSLDNLTLADIWGASLKANIESNNNNIVKPKEEQETDSKLKLDESTKDMTLSDIWGSSFLASDSQSNLSNESLTESSYQWSLDGCLDGNIDTNNLSFNDNNSVTIDINFNKNDNIEIVINDDTIDFYVDTVLSMNNNIIEIQTNTDKSLEETIFESSRVLKIVLEKIYKEDKLAVINNNVGSDNEVVKVTIDTIIELALSKLSKEYLDNTRVNSKEFDKLS